jgi:hypothetical protein
VDKLSIKPSSQHFLIVSKTLFMKFSWIDLYKWNIVCDFLGEKTLSSLHLSDNDAFIVTLQHAARFSCLAVATEWAYLKGKSDWQYTVELHLSGRWLSRKSIIQIGLVFRAKHKLSLIVLHLF